MSWDGGVSAFLPLTMNRRTRPKPEGGTGGTFGIDAIMMDRCYEGLMREILFVVERERDLSGILRHLWPFV